MPKQKLPNSKLPKTIKKLIEGRVNNFDIWNFFTIFVEIKLNI
jgi:hypothetical protein